MSVLPVLKTAPLSIREVDGRKRTCIKRQISVTDINKGNQQVSSPSQSRSALFDAFHELYQHEMSFQELLTDLSISAFCRTYAVDNSVILEVDREYSTLRECLENKSATLEHVLLPVKYLASLHRKTCVKRMSNNGQAHHLSKFLYEKSKQVIAESLIESAFNFHDKTTDKKLSSLHFASTDITKKIDELIGLYKSSSLTVVHGNFTAENILLNLSVSCIKNIVSFGAELSHIGNPFYDLGVYMGELLIWHHIHELSSHVNNDEDREYNTLLERSIVECLAFYFDEVIFCEIRENMPYVAGFAGLHMISRLTNKNWYVELPKADPSLLNDIMDCALRLIDGYTKITSPNHLLVHGLMLV